MLGLSSPALAECTPDNTKSAEAATLSKGICISTEISQGQALLDWPVDPAAAEELWTVRVTRPEGTFATLAVRTPDGEALTLNQTASAEGEIVLADLALAAGDYKVQIGARPDGPVVVELVPSGPADGSLPSEPNGLPEQANAISLDQPMRGRLYGVHLGSDKDYFAITVDALTLADAVLEGPDEVTLAMAVMSADNRTVQERKGTGRIELVDLGLEPGTHWFRVAGQMSADQVYTFTLKGRGAPAPTQELEPNDKFDQATRTGETLRGRLTEGETDYLAITVEGEPQLWRFQAVGDQFTHFALHDGGSAVISRGTREKNQRFVRLSNILLGPGTHVISISGKPGPYVIRAIPLGPPPEPVDASAPDDTPSSAEVLATVQADSESLPLTTEIEPNDGHERAMRLEFGKRQTGTLDRRGDVDLYLFHLSAPQRVQLRLTADPEMRLTGRLYWGMPEAQRAALSVPVGSEKPLIWNALLPAGDYALSLSAKEPLAKAYAVELIRQPFFEPGADLEPNDTFYEASTVPTDLRIAGDILQKNDTDWYRLPARDAETTLTITSTDGSDRYRRLDLYELLPRPDAKVWVAPKTKGVANNVTFPGDAWSGPIPAGADLLVKITGDQGPYALQFVFGDQAPRPEAEAPPVKMALTFDTQRLAAFSRYRQTVSGVLTITADADAKLAFSYHADDALWQLSGLPEEMDLQSGQTTEIPVTLRIPPGSWDDKARLLSVGARNATGGAVWTEASFIVDETGPDANPELVWNIPEALLGGINVASGAFGASAVVAGTTYEMYVLNDDLLNEQGSIRATGKNFGDNGVLIDLMGDQPHQVRGMIFNQPRDAFYASRIRDFEISASTDGQTFAPVGQFQLTQENPQQSFVFDQPLVATSILVRALTSRAPAINDSWVGLDDIKVIAAPGALGPEDPEIGLHRRGGHVVQFTPYFDWTAILDPDRKPRIIPIKRRCTTACGMGGGFPRQPCRPGQPHRLARL
ncbi:MAG: hypothetical protein AAF666_14465 [Pseudomonadota bacterium]